ncbi:O-antigen ligase family protein [Roseibacterium sp. SDUM158017]|uniref:O-antigen ligase family protein n=1 Tax=Roseicyclus salinarum TaxID=3036773 RepID=UPI0024158C89|nr:O-antigen ligase family protein [Roseibacterium sp. SDUM158017]MDG4649640.1 O-antigen ligase family protein [Roseibacterium sp. SDUM158017]
MTTIALAVWPLVTLLLVLLLPFPKAVALSILGGFFLLPPDIGINLPLLPTFNKASVPALSLLVCALLLYRRGDRNGVPVRDMPGWIPRSFFGTAGIVMLVLGAMMTALTNGDRLVFGSTVLPPLRLYDGFSFALVGLTMVVPLLLGRKFFAHPENQVLLLRYLIVGGLAYSLLALYEIRMSPQLNRMVYGFYPSSWVQNIRGGGFRPIVFMEHGLQLAIFLAAVTLAAFGASRCLEPRRRGFYLFAGAWLLVTLVLANSLGALVIAVVFLPVVLLLGTRAQLLFAAIVAAIIMLYPMLRGADLIPTDRLVSITETIDTRRAGSLQYRFDNEDILLARAQERPLFGWGGWRRNRVFDDTGNDISTTDGAWVVAIGQRGWVGYLAQFGLLALPVVLLAFNRRRQGVSPVTAVLAVILAASLVDLIPNGFLSPVTMLLAGALWGRLELGAAAETADEAVKAPAARIGYARAVSPAETSDENQESRPYTRQEVRHRRVRRSS